MVDAKSLDSAFDAAPRYGGDVCIYRKGEDVEPVFNFQAIEQIKAVLAAAEANHSAIARRLLARCQSNFEVTRMSNPRSLRFGFSRRVIATAEGADAGRVEIGARNRRGQKAATATMH